MTDSCLDGLLLCFSWNLFSGLCPKRTRSPVCIIPIFNVNLSTKSWYRWQKLLHSFVSNHNFGRFVFFFPPSFSFSDPQYWYRMNNANALIWVHLVVCFKARLSVRLPVWYFRSFKRNGNKDILLKALEPRTDHVNNTAVHQSFLALAYYKDPAEQLLSDPQSCWPASSLPPSDQGSYTARETDGLTIKLGIKLNFRISNILKLYSPLKNKKKKKAKERCRERCQVSGETVGSGIWWLVITELLVIYFLV